MMVSDLIKTLKRKKLIRKKSNPEDGRSFIVCPTTLGERVTNSAVLKVEALDDDFFRSVSNIAEFRKDLLLLAQGEVAKDE